MTEFGRTLRATGTSIPGLILWDLPVHGDGRGWFKENWQREKMWAAGALDFDPVQNNVSFNDAVGTTRGIHAEPWDKLVSVAAGRVFGAWVDLREGPTFGAVFTTEIGASQAVFVPRGVGNAYQTLAPDTAYTYLVNDHWSPDATYTFLNLDDETAAIDWPIPLDRAIVSAKDLHAPRLAEVIPMQPKRLLVVGSRGQLGRALRNVYDEATHVEFVDRDELDITAGDIFAARRWRDYSAIINAAAYTAVDRAETPEGRADAWRINATAVASLAKIAAENDLTLVHVSTDYVFDGALERAYREDDPLSPLSVYGQSKAAGDAAASTIQRHYIVRTSWVVGEGPNFVRTMANLAARGVDPRVVADQRGRLTTAHDLARGIRHLLDSHAPYGVYNLTGGGDPQTWAEVARTVFLLRGADPDRVTPVTTAEYYSAATEPVAPRPRNSVLDLTKIEATGFRSKSTADLLTEYLSTIEN
jgi:dTDP-4-dehydrorhamnose 3,5-epimerase